MTAALRAITEDDDAAGKTTAVLFQDFQVRCRMLQACARHHSIWQRSRAGLRQRAQGSFKGLEDEWAPALEAGPQGAR